MQEDLEHPKFSVQHYFDRGTIIDYDIDEENHKIIVYVRITDPSIIERIKSGELEFVSPSVIPKGSEEVEQIGEVDVLKRTLPLHLAIVGEPAYGKDKAKMTHLCTGNGDACLNRLKIMNASKYAAGQECVSRKIKIIKEERPNISNDQAAAIAYSMCGESKKANESDMALKTMNASINKINSLIEQARFGMKYPIFEGKGRNLDKGKKYGCVCCQKPAYCRSCKESVRMHKIIIYLCLST